MVLTERPGEGDLQGSMALSGIIGEVGQWRLYPAVGFCPTKSS